MIILVPAVNSIRHRCLNVANVSTAMYTILRAKGKCQSLPLSTDVGATTSPIHRVIIAVFHTAPAPRKESHLSYHHTPCHPIACLALAACASLPETYCLLTMSISCPWRPSSSFRPIPLQPAVAWPPSPLLVSESLPDPLLPPLQPFPLFAPSTRARWAS